MKKYIVSKTLNTYEVLIEFGGMVGSQAYYTVESEDELDAEIDVVEMARNDLSIEDVYQVEDDEWEVEVGFQGMTGVSEIYSVNADNEAEAEDEGIEAAIFDINILDVKLVN